MTYLIVFLGAGLGGALRHGVNLWAVRVVGVSTPLGTLLVNVSGSLCMGVLVGAFASRAGILPQHVRLFLTTGMLGGFTTFSAFSLELALLIERNLYAAAIAYGAGSILLSVTALFVGMALVNGIQPLP